MKTLALAVRTVFATACSGFSEPSPTPAPKGWAVTTLAGQAGASDRADGVGAAARLLGPYANTSDGANLYVLDAALHPTYAFRRKVIIGTGEIGTGEVVPIGA